MSRNIVETALGAVVIAIAVVFASFAYSSTHVDVGKGYEVTAKFEHIDGTSPGGDVRISGIKVGTIISQELDPNTYQAVVKFSINNSVKLPVDTVATITSSGLLGDKYMQLVPGADDKMIPPGGEIKITQPPVSLEAMLGQYVFSTQGSNGKGGGNASAGSAAAKPPSALSTTTSPPSTSPTPSQ